MANAQRGWRYWRVHFTFDESAHWVNVDCGEPVTESRAVELAERAHPARGKVTACVQDPMRPNPIGVAVR